MVGGAYYDTKGATQTIEVLDPKTRTWTVVDETLQMASLFHASTLVPKEWFNVTQSKAEGKLIQ